MKKLIATLLTLVAVSTPIQVQAQNQDEFTQDISRLLSENDIPYNSETLKVAKTTALQFCKTLDSGVSVHDLGNYLETTVVDSPQESQLLAIVLAGGIYHFCDRHAYQLD